MLHLKPLSGLFGSGRVVLWPSLAESALFPGAPELGLLFYRRALWFKIDSSAETNGAGP